MKISSKISNGVRPNFNEKIFIPVLIAIIVVVTVFWAWKTQKLVIQTDGIKYDNGSTLRLKIRNLSFRSICFSSCYPYYLQWKTDPRASVEWGTYSYQSCPNPDLAEKCIGSLRSMAFEASLPKIKKGIHRISVPVCENCKVGEQFRETKRFYSNEFEIK